MIKVSGMYANQDGNRFDIDYYCTKHMPRVGELLGPALRNMAVEGLAGMTPGSPAPYLAMGPLYFDSVAHFKAPSCPTSRRFSPISPISPTASPPFEISSVKL
jgi:uncharacterized protein (TIGR02118 family)